MFNNNVLDDKFISSLIIKKNLNISKLDSEIIFTNPFEYENFSLLYF
jgi:hypothetical protein